MSKEGDTVRAWHGTLASVGARIAEDGLRAGSDGRIWVALEPQCAAIFALERVCLDLALRGLADKPESAQQGCLVELEMNPETFGRFARWNPINFERYLPPGAPSPKVLRIEVLEQTIPSAEDVRAMALLALATRAYLTSPRKDGHTRKHLMNGEPLGPSLQERARFAVEHGFVSYADSRRILAPNTLAALHRSAYA